MDRAGKDSGGSEELPPTDPPDGAPSERELLARLGELRDEFADWVKQGAKLFGAESKLFASTLLLIVMLAVTAAFVIAGALLFLVAAMVLLLIEHGGMDPVIAALLATLALVAIAVGCLLCMRGLTRHLRFTESRRMLSRLTGSQGPDA